MGKAVLPNGPAVPSLENQLHGHTRNRIIARGRTVGIAAGASQYEPPVAARAPTLFYAGASCISTFPAPREVAGPLLWEKGSCQMGPQRRVWKITFMGPLYKELMHEAEPWGLRRGRASTSPQLPHGPPRFFMQVLLAFLRSGAAGSGGTPFIWEKGSCQNGPAAPSLENNLHGPALQRINARG